MTNKQQTSVDWLLEQIQGQGWGFITISIPKEIIHQARKMNEQELKGAYEHGSDDENCRLSDGAMAPDYENADEWYQGEYGGKNE